jgi:membrane protease YdiL (CAAX protease family)
MEHKRALSIIVVVGLFFGLAHIISGEPWSEGKFAQAAISGIIIGWVYYRYGLISAILVHWATNYFIYSYIFFISDLNQISIQNALSHSMIGTLEIILVATGIISLGMVILNYFNQKNQKKLSM